MQNLFAKFLNFPDSLYSWHFWAEISGSVTTLKSFVSCVCIRAKKAKQRSREQQLSLSSNVSDVDRDSSLWVFFIFQWLQTVVLWIFSQQIWLFPWTSFKFMPIRTKNFPLSKRVNKFDCKNNKMRDFCYYEIGNIALGHWRGNFLITSVIWKEFQLFDRFNLKNLDDQQ